MRRVIFLFFIFSERAGRARGGGEGGEGALPDIFFFFPYSADHERDWPPVFFGMATNALNVRNSNNNNTRHQTQQAPMKLKLAADAAGVRRINMCSEKKKLHAVRRGRRRVVQRR